MLAHEDRTDATPGKAQLMAVQRTSTEKGSFRSNSGTRPVVMRSGEAAYDAWISRTAFGMYLTKRRVGTRLPVDRFQTP